MRNPFRFITELMQQPVWIPVWVLFLMIINVASVAFWDELLAKVIFVVFMLSAILMMGLYSKFGYKKILGLGHILWIPLLVCLMIKIPSATDIFKSYLIILSISIVISLVLDTGDVWKYFSNREKT